MNLKRGECVGETDLLSGGLFIFIKPEERARQDAAINITDVACFKFTLPAFFLAAQLNHQLQKDSVSEWKMISAVSPFLVILFY